jgi:chaperonin GroEL
MTWQGTTTATVCTSYCKRRIENVAAGANPMDLKRGIDKAVQVTDLAKQSKVVGTDSDKIKQIASISANNDEVMVI